MDVLSPKPFDIASVPLGMSRDSEEFRTSSHRLASFARAVDDTNPRHLAGEYALPVFAHIPVMQSMVEVLQKTASGLILHGEHDFVFHRPIVPGQRLFTVSTLIGARGTSAGTAVVIGSYTRDHAGEPVCTQYSTCLLREAGGRDARGEKAPERPQVPRGEGVADTYPLPLDQTRRYADAARDYSAYTIDPEAAQAAGFPAPIVHGMCTLAFAARAIVDRHCGGESKRLRRLGCRFVHPLYLLAGQTLRVEHWAGEGGLAGFEASDAEGNLVIKNGYAQVSR
jgi:acyl dehydratase